MEAGVQPCSEEGREPGEQSVHGIFLRDLVVRGTGGQGDSCLRWSQRKACFLLFTLNKESWISKLSYDFDYFSNVCHLPCLKSVIGDYFFGCCVKASRESTAAQTPSVLLHVLLKQAESPVFAHMVSLYLRETPLSTSKLQHATICNYSFKITE